MRRWSTVVAALVALAVLVGACGDGDETSAATADPSTTTSTPVEAEGSEVPATPTEITVTHAQGDTVVPVNPETVVVFDLGVVVTLDELGVDIAGVPEVQNLPDSLARYGGSDFVKVGTLFEPDYERVNALEPDLIIVAGRSAAVLPQLSEIAPTIDLTVDNTDFITSFRQRTQTLGDIFDARDEVDARLAEIDAAVERTQALAADAGTGLIVLTSGGEVTAYGPGSRFGLIHDVLGVAPAVADIEAATHGDAISFEFILDANPDILFVIDRDSGIGQQGEAAQAVLDNEIVARTTAWQNDDVVYLDPFSWYIAPGGLGSVTSMVAAIEAALG